MILNFRWLKFLSLSFCYWDRRKQFSKALSIVLFLAWCVRKIIPLFLSSNLYICIYIYFFPNKHKFLGCWSLLMTPFWTYILIHVFKLQCSTSTRAFKLESFWCYLTHLNTFPPFQSTAEITLRCSFWIRWRWWQLIKQNSWMYHQTLCQMLKESVPCFRHGSQRNNPTSIRVSIVPVIK